MSEDDTDIGDLRDRLYDQAINGIRLYMEVRQGAVTGADLETGDPARPVLRGEGALAEADHIYRLSVSDLFASMTSAMLKVITQFDRLSEQVEALHAKMADIADGLQKDREERHYNMQQQVFSSPPLARLKPPEGS